MAAVRYGSAPAAPTRDFTGSFKIIEPVSASWRERGNSFNECVYGK
jgi:hypothetical protein